MKELLFALGLFFAEGETSEVVIPETQEQEIVETEDTIKDKVSDVLSQYFDVSLVANIITWLSEAGILSALLIISTKYSKYKNMTISDLIALFNNKINEEIEKQFKKFGADEVKKITNSVENLQKSQEIIMKVLVLMQDSTEKGKVALLDYLGSKTNDEAIKEQADETKAQIKEQIEVKEQVVEKVQGEYKEIF